MHVSNAGQQPPDRLLHLRVEVDWIDHLHVGMGFGDVGQRLANILETFAEVLAPVAGDQHQALGRVKKTEVFFKLLPHESIGNYFFAHLQQRVNHGVSGDMDFFRRHTFVQQIAA